MASNRSVKHNHNVKPVGKRITQQKDADRERALIYFLNGPDPTIKPMKPQAMKQHPITPITLKHPLQANQTQRSPIQKTNFATTPNI